MRVHNDFEWADPHTLKVGDCFLDETGCPQIVTADSLEYGDTIEIIQWQGQKAIVTYHRKDAESAVLKVPNATFEVVTALAPVEPPVYSGLTAFMADDGIYLLAFPESSTTFGTGRTFFNISANEGMRYSKHCIAPITSYRIWPNEKMRDGASSPLLAVET